MSNREKSKKLYHLVLSAMFLAIALVLPFLTGQMQQVGNALLPMHLPVLLCAFFCGPWYAMGIGAIAPLLRFALFGMPIIMPIGAAMAFELATYGLVCGLLYTLLKNKRAGVYISLISAMIAGRVVWGIVRAFMYGVSEYTFGWKMFIAGAFVNAIPGIIIQIVIIPILVMALKKYTYKK